jgi:alcohol dehydrogenase class IV
MNISFNLTKIPQINFGPGKIQTLAKEILQFGKNVLVVVGKESFIESPKGSEILELLEKSGIKTHIISTATEPSVTFVDSVCEKFRDEKIDVIVAIGGGSVIDAGKAVSAMHTTSGSIKDFLEGVGNKIHSGDKIPFIAVPTTSGTGSEATANAVISEVGNNGFKKSIRHPNFIPNVAIVDPELCVSCPQALTAASGMDAFTQLVESYLSTKASPLTDAFAIEGIKHINLGLVKAFNDGSNIEARSSLAYAAMLSGITLANAGLGTVHGFASSIGGYFNIPHGMVCGSLMAVCNEFTIRSLRKNNPESLALSKYAELGKIFSDEKDKSMDYYVDSFLGTLYALTDLFSIKRLGDYGIQESDFEKIISLTENKNNPVALSNIELAEILKLRL